MDVEQSNADRHLDDRPLAIVRIYFRAMYRTTGTFWQRVMRAPTALRLTQEALKAGFLCAIATEGSAGFVRGCRRVEIRSLEGSPLGLPSCLELVASELEMDRFLMAHRKELADSIIVRCSGSDITHREMAEIAALPTTQLAQT